MALDDDEFMAQLDFLRNDYDSSLLQIGQMEIDIQRLMDILKKHGLKVPAEIEA